MPEYYCEHCGAKLNPDIAPVFSAYWDKDFCDSDHAYEWSANKIETLSGESLERFYKVEQLTGDNEKLRELLKTAARNFPGHFPWDEYNELVVNPELIATQEQADG